ncbi:glycosyltransferase family 39 protein [bacterium]|nr:glycosyltransferase family 39 protein [bacterium]
MNKILEYLKKNYIETAIILCVTIIALILRLILLYNYGDLWLDELYSWYFANQKTAFGTVWELLKQDLHMPLYFVILHFWMKIFGKSDISMHTCTLVLTLPLIPISYYLMKSLFNKTTGYFAALMFAINTFCIYYSIEVRFYGLVFVLSLLSAFTFVKMLENFDKKCSVAFITVHSLLLYTFSITPLLTFFYGLVGGVYVWIYKNEKLQEYLKQIGLLTLIALPVVFFTIYNIIVMKLNAICSFTRDIYFFKWSVITDTLENFFTSFNYQLMTGNVNDYHNIFSYLNSALYLVFVFIPIIIGIAGLLRSLFSKNEKLYLFLLPSVLFVFTALVLASLGLMSFLTRYASIVYPVIICSVCYGLSLIRPKFVAIVLAGVYFAINYGYFYTGQQTVLNHSRVEIGNMTEVMNKRIKPQDDTLFLIPYSGSKVMKYVPKGQLIEFFADDALLLKDDKSRTFYFDDKFYKQVDKKNFKESMRYDIISNEPFILYNIRLSDFYFKKMKKGQKFVIISYRDAYIAPIIENWYMLQDSEFYKKLNVFILSMAKMTKDSIALADEYLKRIDTYIDYEHNYAIYVYEKQ